MTPEISEFSYGFALTNEIVGWTPLHTAPIFPSLIEEGKQGGGYDVKLDLPAVALFLQFKRSQFMTRRSAREIKHHQLDLEVPFHRFDITERNRSFQHTSLVTLDDGQNAVFYVAPRFHTLEAINSAWSHQMVAQRSVFVAPSEIGLIEDDEAHSVAFDPFITYFCSEPREIAATSIEQLRKRLLSQLGEDQRPLRAKLPEWKQEIRDARTRAFRAQDEIERSIFERRLAAKLGQTARRGMPQLEGDGYAQALPPPAFRMPDESFRRPPPPPPPMELRKPRPLSDEEADLQEVSDEARRTFNTLLIVVQAAES